MNTKPTKQRTSLRRPNAGIGEMCVSEGALIIAVNGQREASYDKDMRRLRVDKIKVVGKRRRLNRHKREQIAEIHPRDRTAYPDHRPRP